MLMMNPPGRKHLGHKNRDSPYYPPLQLNYSAEMAERKQDPSVPDTQRTSRQSTDPWEEARGTQARPGARGILTPSPMEVTVRVWVNASGDSLASGPAGASPYHSAAAAPGRWLNTPCIPTGWALPPPGCCSLGCLQLQKTRWGEKVQKFFSVLPSLVEGAPAP